MDQDEGGDGHEDLHEDWHGADEAL